MYIYSTSVEILTVYTLVYSQPRLFTDREQSKPLKCGANGGMLFEAIAIYYSFSFRFATPDKNVLWSNERLRRQFSYRLNASTLLVA